MQENQGIAECKARDAMISSSWNLILSFRNAKAGSLSKIMPVLFYPTLEQTLEKGLYSFGIRSDNRNPEPKKY